MIATGNIVLDDAVTFRVIKVGWRHVWLEVTIGQDAPFTRKYRKHDSQKCQIKVNVRP